MPPTFAAIDFETAIGYHACAVGIVTVQNGVVVDEYVTLIQPPDNYYHWGNIHVHGITPENTEHSPLFPQVFPEIEKRLTGKIVVAHNEAFDRNVLLKNMLYYGLDTSGVQLYRWECTCKIYRKKGYKPATLNACCARNGITLNHHEALSDARGCAELYLRHLSTR